MCSAKINFWAWPMPFKKCQCKRNGRACRLISEVRFRSCTNKCQRNLKCLAVQKMTGWCHVKTGTKENKLKKVSLEMGRVLTKKDQEKMPPK